MAMLRDYRKGERSAKDAKCAKEKHQEHPGMDVGSNREAVESTAP
jgi:hypothetical protein